MTEIDMLYLYDLILWAIVGTYMAARVLRQWSITYLKRDPAKIAVKAAAAAEKAAEKVKKAEEKMAARLAAMQKKAGDAVDGARSAAADSLRDTADAVDPETT